jgi:hypothetical protein
MKTNKAQNFDVTFSEIAHDVSATVETICHHACSPPQRFMDGLAATSFGATSNLRMYKRERERERNNISQRSIFSVETGGRLKLLRGSMFNLSAANFRYEISPGLGGLTITPICKRQT